MRTWVVQWEWRLLAAAVALSLMGALAMVSAASMLNPALAWRHAIWIGLGVLLSLAAAYTNYRQWSAFSVVLYGVSVISLMLVLAVGHTRLGATRWLSVLGLSLQPSELAKFALVWLLARYVAGQPSPLPLRSVLVSLAMMGVPALLIFIQPDLGSASILVAIWLGIVWAAGMPARVLMGMSALALALLPVGWHLLKDYQRDRLMVFLNPHVDPLGAGFSIIQSTIAIGSGQLWGRGWLAGTQNQLNFLPERHSDFIFSVIGEEWGFLGCAAVVAGFAILLTRSLRVAQATSDPYGRLLAVGVFSWVAYQTCVNMGMVMGILPVVGVPLPLISYGGSSMIAIWVAFGLLLSVWRLNR